MSQRSKRRVKNRSRVHRDRVKAGHTMRKKRIARGVHTAAKRRKKRAARKPRRTSPRG